MLGWVLLLELGDVPVVLAVSSVVHPEEAQCQEQAREEGLRHEEDGAPGDELPEVVGAGDDREAVEPRHLAREVVVGLPEAPQVLVAQHVHQLGKQEHNEESPVHVPSVIGDLCPKELGEERCLLVKRVEKIEGNKDPEEEPKVADLLHDHIQ